MTVSYRHIWKMKQEKKKDLNSNNRHVYTNETEDCNRQQDRPGFELDYMFLWVIHGSFCDSLFCVRVHLKQSQVNSYVQKISSNKH